MNGFFYVLLVSIQIEASIHVFRSWSLFNFPLLRLILYTYLLFLIISIVVMIEWMCVYIMHVIGPLLSITMLLDSCEKYYWKTLNKYTVICVRLAFFFSSRSLSFSYQSLVSLSPDNSKFSVAFDFAIMIAIAPHIFGFLPTERPMNMTIHTSYRFMLISFLFGLFSDFMCSRSLSLSSLPIPWKTEQARVLVLG